MGENPKSQLAVSEVEPIPNPNEIQNPKSEQSPGPRRSALDVRCSMFLLILTLLPGCATTVTTARERIPVYRKPIDLRIAIGAFEDHRIRTDGAKLSPKQIHISPAQVKNAIVDILNRSRRFRNIVNLSSAGSVPELLEEARGAGCDYLVVGEIDLFDVLDLGVNPLYAASMLLETATFPIGLTIFLLTDRKAGLWVNSAIHDRTAVGILSVTLRFIETDNGEVAGSLNNVTARATTPINVTVYGDLDNPDDDWIDIGKELGLVALHNLGVALTKQMGEEVERISIP